MIDPQPQLIKISQLRVNPDNPRLIKDSKYDKLKKSIKKSPQMLLMRPIVTDETLMILGGNMRYRACKELGMKNVYVSVYTEEYHKTTDAFKNDNVSYKEFCDEFLIKDNVSFGEWDWAMIGNSWNTTELEAYGFDVWQNPDDVAKVNGGDENSEWVGMPEFDEKDNEYKISITFDSEKDRQEYAAKYNMEFTVKSDRVWSTIYPYEKRKDLSSLKYE